MPTDPAALRALLLEQARRQQAQAIAEEERIMAEHGKKGSVAQPGLSDDDYVFDQATTMLWNPLVGPALRSALYHVLAQTPGVMVRAGATDGLGRAAVQISRYEKAAAVDEQTFEDPRTGAVLETAFLYRDNGTKGTDLYLSVKGSNTLPPDPYRG